ncbi:MAG: tRNA uridine(34) 5-carboxymethylaminomethyl synthesis GTPase MnmE [Thermobacillus sp. ZCTH02-B1]|uniref:tRNA uridine-5-carboxymethylaminomethyl(34) synthesis GTPase MnmE n=1 Tax=Thermobacillus sp. ZCTH02-B1 TaxID=1858795 RepID=UPI000B56481C|nr:tRNA uridine-5-carboxymethylaminomethyl(34) synthesis GTPase MnmE [Thermobacillus sp. ZCTH02-B1]OUM93716.1 MAG: tRNA uridine(34) 5-carboxymethylaminomethyl synthesis GTPase MnmE [Thermobacillus sp. ZCTH02-B1]
MQDDTIAAIATAVGESGIAVIRISGPDAIGAAAPYVRAKVGLADAATHTVQYAKIIDPSTGETVDEALVTVMRAPKSFTAEDVVEISVHGGVVPVRRVLDLLLAGGRIRLAEPGEFTRRAFLNGRIDLAQAEAVMDLIRSKSERAMKVALKQVEGKLSRKIREIRQRLVELLAHLEVNIDYPEHDVPELTSAFLRERCGEALEEIRRLLKSANEGRILREGITTAIVGRPNVGKSSLLNLLAGAERAIVTDIPGTTRDVIEEYVTVNGIPLRLLDTAGIRETTDVVERIGVERSRSALADADLLLVVLNRSEPLHDDDRDLLRQAAGRQAIVILNKTDLPAKLDEDEVRNLLPGAAVVPMSAKEGRGLGELGQAIAALFFGGKLEGAEETVVSNARHAALLRQAERSLVDAIESTDAGVPIDIVQIDVRTAWERLGEITGDTAGESLIDQIFSQFCLGK